MKDIQTNSLAYTNKEEKRFFTHGLSALMPSGGVRMACGQCSWRFWNLHQDQEGWHSGFPHPSLESKKRIGEPPPTPTPHCPIAVPREELFRKQSKGKQEGADNWGAVPLLLSPKEGQSRSPSICLKSCSSTRVASSCPLVLCPIPTWPLAAAKQRTDREKHPTDDADTCPRSTGQTRDAASGS